MAEFHDVCAYVELTRVPTWLVHIPLPETLTSGSSTYSGSNSRAEHKGISIK